jgi:GDP-L-fucose synthase
MIKDSRIYVAGHRGLAGSAIVRRLQAGGYRNIVGRSHAELELTNQAAVEAFFNKERPEYVFLAAAKVGGIQANNTFRAEFIYQNLMIEANVINSSYQTGVKKLLFLGTSCIYPKFAPQPMKEEHLLTGTLEPTNEPYAIAKIAGIKMCNAYNRQYGADYLAVMPTNLYGPGDNYDLQQSHVLPALIRKMHDAKVNGDEEMVVWGSGSPLREFLYSDDLADACVLVMEKLSAAEIGEFMNIGSGQEYTIRQAAELVRKVIEFNGRLVFDTSKPDGTPRKLLDPSRMQQLGWTAKTKLEDGLRTSYRDFLQRFAA